jgi:hypothetical protein
MRDTGENATAPVRDDIATVCAIAVLAICATTVAHEAMGHGGACLLLGGRIMQLTNVYFQCSVHSRFIAPAGPAGNYLAGILAWLAQFAIPRHAVRARLLALLIMAFSLFWEAGYLISAMATAHGDYVFAARDFLGNPEWAWRAGGIVVGILLYRLFIRTLAACLRSFATTPARVPRLLRSAWLAALVTACAAASLYASGRVGAMAQAAGEVAGAFPLLYPYARIHAAENNAAPTIMRSHGWIGIAVVVFAIFVATLGRGLP